MCVDSARDGMFGVQTHRWTMLGGSQLLVMNRIITLRVLMIHVWTCQSFTPMGSTHFPRAGLFRRNMSNQAAASTLMSNFATQFQVPEDKELLIHWKQVLLFSFTYNILDSHNLSSTH